jgi:NTE family protein
MTPPQTWTTTLAKLLPSLDGEGMAYLIGLTAQVALAKGDILFSQGDMADALYVVVKGKVGAFLREPAGEEIFIGPIGAGEKVGENGIIVQQPRALTVRALTNCELLQLSSIGFAQFCHRYPLSVLDITRLLIRRSRQTLTKFVEKEHRQRRVALVFLQKDTLYHTCVHMLQQRLTCSDRVRIITSDARPYSQMSQEAVIASMEERQPTTRVVVLCTDMADTIFTHTYEGFFDVLILAVEPAHASPRVQEAWTTFVHTFFPSTIRQELLLLHQELSAGASHSMAALRLDTFTIIHSLRCDVAADYDRLLRFMAGTAVGLVLSGGGARGWAQIGALRAILEHNIPIDAIGGTSIGTIVAGCYATSQGYEDCQRKFQAICRSELRPLTLRNWTIPFVSLLSGKRGTQSLVEHFGDQRIEELPIPFFCVACNLNRSTEVIWQHGLLWQKIRGSMAVPGIVPPLVEHGEMYVDGGVMNNLPVDVMRTLLAPAGTVIAVDVSGDPVDHHQYNFPPAFGFCEGLLTLCKLTKRPYTFPSFWGTMLKSLSMGATKRVQTNRLKADLYIRPHLGPLSFIAIEQGQVLVTAGYEAAQQALATWQSSSEFYITSGMSFLQTKTSNRKRHEAILVGR